MTFVPARFPWCGRCTAGRSPPIAAIYVGAPG